MLESSAKLTFIIHGLGTRPFLFEQSEQLVKSKVSRLNYLERRGSVSIDARG